MSEGQREVRTLRGGLGLELRGAHSASVAAHLAALYDGPSAPLTLRHTEPHWTAVGARFPSDTVLQDRCDRDSLRSGFAWESPTE